MGMRLVTNGHLVTENQRIISFLLISCLLVQLGRYVDSVKALFNRCASVRQSVHLNSSSNLFDWLVIAHCDTVLGDM